MSGNYFQIPGYGSPSWKDPVDTVLSLPADNNQIGDSRVTKDTNDIYIWSGVSWVSPSGGGGTPATTVTDETSYGITPAVGTSILYAREDHTHGSVAAPTTQAESNNSTAIATTAYVDRQALLSTNISRTVRFYDDFWGINGNWVPNTSGTGSISNIRAAKSTPSHPGVWSLQTGTTTGGYANIIATNQDEVFPVGGAGVTTYEIISLMDRLSDGTDTYSVMSGIRSTAYANDMTPANGIYFTYTHGTNSGHWTLNSTVGSSTTSVDMGIGPTAGTYQHLTWVFNAAGTSIQGYIDGTAAGSAITTNLPTTTTKMMLSSMIKKSAGTTNVYYALDAIAFTVNLTSAR
jgi:hypothetical protein